MLASVFALCLIVSAAAAAESPRRFDLPAGEAAQTLKQFAAQSGREIVFAVNAVAKVQTRAVQGDMTPQEALRQMVAGTGLVVTQDARTGAFAVRPGAAPEKNAGSRQAGSPAAPQAVVKLDALEVTGTRIRGMLAGATAQPVLAMDAAQIERTGAQSLGDLFRYIPQISSYSTGQSVTRTAGVNVGAPGSPPVFVPNYTGTNTSASSRTSATLRGTSGDGTLLLVDGRRVPKNNQTNGGDGYDLNGIPLAAIERIEVLLDGASSLYGADAIGGVINVILKKNYRGSEVRVGFENTFDKDAGVFTTSLTHGFGAGRLRGLVTLSLEKANAMALRDRSFTASYDRRPYGGADLRGTVIGGAGRVSRTGTVPLPGLTTTSAAVPPGTTGATITTAEYAAAGAVADTADLAQYQDYSSAYKRRSALANLSYEFSQWLEVYLEARAGRNRNTQAPQPISASLSIPAAYPGNPFGIAVTLSKYFFDVQPERISTNSTLSSVFGARGRFAGDWHYDASVSRVRSHTQADSGSGPSIVAALFNAAVASGQRPNLFYDSTRVANPNAPGVLEALTTAVNEEEITESWIYSAQVDGPVYHLPAGAIAVAAGTEYREEYTDFPLRRDSDLTSALASNREITALFGEVNVPIFAPAQDLALLHQLNLSASFRREHYSDGGNSSNPRAGVAWRPAKWLLLRGSYGEGFKVPNMVQTNAPVRTGSQRFSASVDPLRGNELQNVRFVNIRSGGNPDLRPEQSENATFGAVLEVPRLKGLSVSLDCFDNRFVDRIGAVTFEQRILYFPGRVTRGASLVGDLPGWAGPITDVDTRLVNVAYSETRGYDLGIRYDAATPLGQLMVNVVGTNYTRNVFVPAPGSGPALTVNTDSLPVQVSGSAFLSGGAWGTGALATYRAANRASTSVTVTGSAIRWDWQFNYDFAKSSWARAAAGRWYGKVLTDTKLSLTVFNVFNTAPPFDNMFMPDNTVLDSRLRRYGLSLRREF